MIYGGGAIGGAVARAFARAGARVYLAGRTEDRLEAVANDIGDAAGVAKVDALDERAVAEHADAVAADAGLRRLPRMGYPHRRHQRPTRRRRGRHAPIPHWGWGQKPFQPQRWDHPDVADQGRRRYARQQDRTQAIDPPRGHTTSFVNPETAS